MVDMTEISAIVAATGVLVGVVLTVLELRNILKQRRSDLVVTLSSQFRSREFVEAFHEALSVEFKDYDDFMNKHGAPWSKNPVPVSVEMVCIFFEQLGVLLKNKLIDAYLVSQLFAVALAWEKLRPIVEGTRKEYSEPRLYEWFEYLYNEMKNREKLR